MSADEIVTIPSLQLQVMLEEAAEKGARKALAQVGLTHEDDPEKVKKDIIDLHDLLDGWRAARRNFMSGAFKALGTVMVGAVLAFMAWWTTNGFKGTP